MPSKGSPEDEVKAIHDYDDCDKSEMSHHHTLGRDRFQAAPGNHTHLQDVIITGRIEDGTLLKELLRVLEERMGLIVEVKDK